MIDPKIIEIIKKRGITSEEDIKEYFSDKPSESYDPFLLPDMEEGVDLILSDIDAGKRICIYGDYDADGVTSTVILDEILSEITQDVIHYIPSRFDEGYGLNKQAIDKIKDSGAGLIITVDCGSVSEDEVAYAKEQGLDVVVTDHHIIADKRADAILINPAREDSQYPFRYLAGCGVAFKLGQALVQALGLESGRLTKALDLVALGTVADLVPLIGENRMLVKYGLRVMNTSGRKALLTLIRKTGLEPGTLKAENISFQLAPHINSAGRMASAQMALKLFLTKDEDRMDAYADELVRANSKRKSYQEDVYERAAEQVTDEDLAAGIIVKYLENAHEGVTGIAAGKLKEKYYLPAILASDSDDGMLKGTGRSIEGVDLYELLKNDKDLFSTFGGHKGACGFTIAKDDFGKLADDLRARTKAIKDAEPEEFVQRFDAELDLDVRDATEGFVGQLSLMEPFGTMNPKPLIRMSGIPQGTGTMGKDGRFLRFTLSSGADRIRCVAFSAAERIKDAVEAAERDRTILDVIGDLSKHEWNGRSYVQMEVKQAEAAEQTGAEAR